MSKKRRRQKAARVNLLPAEYADPKKLIEQLVNREILQVPVFDESTGKSKCKSKRALGAEDRPASHASMSRTGHARQFFESRQSILLSRHPSSRRFA